MVELPIWVAIMLIMLAGLAGIGMGGGVMAKARMPAHLDDLDDLERVLCERLALLAEGIRITAYPKQEDIKPDRADPLGQLSRQKAVEAWHERYRKTDGARLARARQT